MLQIAVCLEKFNIYGVLKICLNIFRVILKCEKNVESIENLPKIKILVLNLLNKSMLKTG